MCNNLGKSEATYSDRHVRRLCEGIEEEVLSEFCDELNLKVVKKKKEVCLEPPIETTGEGAHDDSPRSTSQMRDSVEINDYLLEEFDEFFDLNDFDESFKTYFFTEDDVNSVASSETDSEEECESGDTSESELSEVKELSRSDKLAQWAIDHNVPHNAVDSLLKVIKTDFGGSELPVTARTLMRTPLVKLPVRKVSPGEYLHFGVKNGLISVLKNIPSDVTHLTIDFNCDGLPISKSSGKSLWPILGVCNEVIVHCVPFIIGIYYGTSKPTDANDFLKDFVQECKELISCGIIYNCKHYTFACKRLISDFPAKSFVLQV